MQTIYDFTETELGFCLALMCCGLLIVALEWVIVAIERIFKLRRR